MFEGRHLHWKYWEPRADWRGSRSHVLTREERIIAHAAIVHVIDWAACPEARGAGNTLMRHIGALAGSGTVVTRYARPIRPWLYLKDADAARWRLAARCVRNTLWALRAPAGVPGVQRARPVGAEELGGAPIPWPLPRYGSAVLERSAAVMSYWLRCPAAPMELHVVENGAAAEGYFVLAYAPGQARLADCWLDRDDPEAWETLVQLAA